MEIRFIEVNLKFGLTHTYYPIHGVNKGDNSSCRWSEQVDGVIMVNVLFNVIGMQSVIAYLRIIVPV